MEQLDIYGRQWEGGSMRNIKVHKILEGKDRYLKRQVGKLDLENKKGERTKLSCSREVVLL